MNPGAVIVTLPDYGVQEQKFYFQQLENPNEYLIKTFCGLVLDCFEEGEKPGTLVVQWSSS